MLPWLPGEQFTWAEGEARPERERERDIIVCYYIIVCRVGILDKNKILESTANPRRGSKNVWGPYVTSMSSSCDLLTSPSIGRFGALICSFSYLDALGPRCDFYVILLEGLEPSIRRFA